MDYADTLPPQRRFAQTTRPDAWWVQPLLVFLGFSAFIIYSTWAAFNPTYHGSCAYWFDGNGADYLSPFYSPEIFGISPHAIFGTAPGWWPSWLPKFSPAFLILWAPAGFRFTCYYYRGAYYKAFWADPLELCHRRAAQKLSGRTLLPAHHAKHPPLLHVCRGAVHFHSRIRCVGGNVVQGCVRHETFRHRRGNAGSGDERRFARQLHLWLPLAAAFDRRISGRTVEKTRLREGLFLRELPEPPPHDVGVDQPVLGRFHRCLCPAMRDGHLA